MNFKPYPEYKDSGVEWIGEIPKGWEIKRIKHICSESAVYGLNESSENYQEDGIRFIRTTDIDESGNLDKRVNGVFIPKERTIGYILHTGDILVSRSGSLGTSLFFDKEKYGDCSYAGYLVKFRTNNFNLPRFLFYFTKSEMFNYQIQLEAVSSTISNFNGQKYANMKLFTPSLSEQQKISSFLDKKTSEIDLTIEKDSRLIELLKEKRTALINHVVTKGLDPTAEMKDSGVEWIGEIPEDWEVKKLKLISTIVLGKMLTPSDKGGYYLKPYLRAQNISWEHVNTDEIKEMWFSKNELNIYRLHKDDLLVSEGGEVGRTAIWKEEVSECYIQNSVHKVTLNPENNPKYFLYAFESCGKSNFFSSIVNRVSIAHLTREKLKEITFPVPNKREQTQITDYLNVKTTKIDQTIQKIQKNIELLEEYKKSLIHHVVTGKVDVREVAV